MRERERERERELGTYSTTAQITGEVSVLRTNILDSILLAFHH
jgi:hypothetical protein